MKLLTSFTFLGIGHSLIALVFVWVGGYAMVTNNVPQKADFMLQQRTLLWAKL